MARKLAERGSLTEYLIEVGRSKKKCFERGSLTQFLIKSGC